MSLRILQLSDSHVSVDPKSGYRGQNADKNLESLLPAMRAWKPDLMLLTGDISEDASASSYARVAGMLEVIGAPLLALPGNHDNPEVMKHHFPRGPWKGPVAWEQGRWLLVLLDSAEQGRIEGSFSQQYLDGFEDLLAGSSADHVLVALHHQPVAVDAPWIDRYALKHPEPFLKCVDRDGRIRCIVWGHVHHDFRAQRKGVTMLGAPSAATNSLPRTERFTLDPAGPACRWLQLDAKGKVETGLIRPAQSSTGRTSQRIRETMIPGKAAEQMDSRT